MVSFGTLQKKHPVGDVSQCADSAKIGDAMVSQCADSAKIGAGARQSVSFWFLKGCRQNHVTGSKK